MVRMTRKSWDEYFMDIAEVVSTRATCDRKRVGAVIVSDNRRILSTGYNGSVAGAPHCDEVGHEMRDGHCVRTIHAEVNAINQAARHGIRLEGGSIYINTFPCWRCFQQIANVGIRRVVYADAYRIDELVTRTAGELGIVLVELPRSTVVEGEPA
jgi:dCMP deaminase